MSILAMMSAEQNAAVSNLQRTIAATNHALRECANLGMIVRVDDVACITVGGLCSARVLVAEINLPPRKDLSRPAFGEPRRGWR